MPESPTVSATVHVTIGGRCRAAIVTETANSRRGLTLLAFPPHQQPHELRDIAQAASRPIEHTWHHPEAFSACAQQAAAKAGTR